MLIFTIAQEIKRKCKRLDPLLASIIIPAIAMGLAVADFAIHHAERSAVQHEKMAQLELSLKEASTMAQFDAARQRSMQKVFSIIDRCNPRMPVPQKTEIAAEIVALNRKYPNLEIDLICATITQENRTWNPRVVSHAGAMGLMQVMPATGKALALQEAIPWTSAHEVLCHPIYNLRIGCRYMSSLLDSFNDTAGALAAYNGGARLASLWMRHKKENDVLWPETKNYVPAVLKRAEKYRQMDF